MYDCKISSVSFIDFRMTINSTNCKVSEFDDLATLRAFTKDEILLFLKLTYVQHLDLFDVFESELKISHENQNTAHISISSFYTSWECSNQRFSISKN